MYSARQIIETALESDWPRLFGYALTLTKDREMARDLVQQAALNALASANAPGDAKVARAWLFKIVRNLWIDQYRRRAVREDPSISKGLADGASKYEDRIIAEITVRQGMDKLEPSFREIIEFVDLYGFRYTEVATILNIPVGTVMSRISRARLALLHVIAHDNLVPLANIRGQER